MKTRRRFAARWLAAAIAVVALVGVAAPAQAVWTLSYTNGAARQETWYGPSTTSQITGTRTTLWGWVPGGNALTWARTGTAYSALSSGKTVEVSHPAVSQRSTGKWRFVLDPSDPGTVTLDIHRNTTGGGPMRIASSDDVVPAELLAVLSDPLGDRVFDHVNRKSIGELVDPTTLRFVGEVDRGEYWVGISYEGDIALVAALPGGVSAVALASPEQFAAEGLSLAVGVGGIASEPVYLVPDASADQAALELDPIGVGLYTSSDGTARDPLIRLGSDVALVRILATDVFG